MPKNINFAVPDGMFKDFENAFETGKYKSKNEFFKDLIRLWNEEQVLIELRKSQKEISEGKGKVLKSLKDLR